MEKIEEQLKKLSLIKMTTEERNRLRAGVISRVMEKSRTFKFSIKSPWSFGRMPLFTKVTAAILIAILVGGGTLTYASEKSLPGDLLFPIKIGVAENIIEGSLIHSPEDVLNWQQVRLTRRIDEVKQLKKKGAISKKQAAIVTSVVKDHVVQIQSAISTLKSEGKSDVVLASTATLIPIVASLDEETDAEVDTKDDTTSKKEEEKSDLDSTKSEPLLEDKSKTPLMTETTLDDDSVKISDEDKISEDTIVTEKLEIDLEDATKSLEADIKKELKKIEDDVKSVADDSDNDAKKDKNDNSTKDNEKDIKLEIDSEVDSKTDSKTDSDKKEPQTNATKPSKETTNSKNTTEIKLPSVPVNVPATVPTIKPSIVH